MQPRLQTQVKQNDARRLFRAALDAGFDRARIVIHPDGRIEATASFADPANSDEPENSIDRLLK